MAYYALEYKTVNDFINRRVPFRAEHLRLVHDAHQRGEIAWAGALGDPPDGALLIFHIETASVAEEFATARSVRDQRSGRRVAGASLASGRGWRDADVATIAYPPGPPRSFRTLIIYGPGRDPLAFFTSLARTYGDIVARAHGGRAPVSRSTIRDWSRTSSSPISAIS